MTIPYDQVLIRTPADVTLGLCEASLRAATFYGSDGYKAHYCVPKDKAESDSDYHYRLKQGLAEFMASQGRAADQGTGDL